jgi:hypothetical protein
MVPAAASKGMNMMQSSISCQAWRAAVVVHYEEVSARLDGSTWSMRSIDNRRCRTWSGPGLGIYVVLHCYNCAKGKEGDQYTYICKAHDTRTEGKLWWYIVLRTAACCKIKKRWKNFQLALLITFAFFAGCKLQVSVFVSFSSDCS